MTGLRRMVSFIFYNSNCSDVRKWNGPMDWCQEQHSAIKVLRGKSWRPSLRRKPDTSSTPGPRLSMLFKITMGPMGCLCTTSVFLEEPSPSIRHCCDGGANIRRIMATVSSTRQGRTIRQDHLYWYVSTFRSLNKYQFLLFVLRLSHSDTTDLRNHSSSQRMGSIIWDILVSSTTIVALQPPSLRCMRQLPSAAGYDPYLS